LTYDHLVLALGAVSNNLGLPNIQQRAFDFKTVLDTIRLRNQVADGGADAQPCGQRADGPHHPLGCDARAM